MEDSETDKEEDDSDLSVSDDEDEESQDDDSGDDSDGAKVDLELRNKIEEALRVNGIEPATGETDSEDEELMDDDQMMAIDEQLAQVFRSRRNEKKGGKGMFY
jgi:DNA polymerase phi